MPSPALVDLSQASANAMLTARTSKAISAVLRGNALDPRNQQVVERAAEFLKGVVQGSVLVENTQVVGVSASHENLREFVRALSALQSLNLLSQNATVAEVFSSYRVQLLDLAKGQQVPGDDLQRLRRFFSELSSYFYSDLTRPVSEHRGDRLPPEP